MTTTQCRKPAQGHALTVYQSLHEVVRAYLESLRGRPCYRTKVYTASQWILTLQHTPTRKEVLTRHLDKGHGHYQPGSCQANMELGLLRAACRWGLYQECWEGGDPTLGIRKWRRPKRSRTGKHDELRTLLLHFDEAVIEYDIRDRALFGLMLCTGCRPSEALRCKLDAIRPYGEMGSWIKGTTKTGEPQELPLPTQLMPWLAAWTEIRYTDQPNPFLFPGQDMGKPISDKLVRYRWSKLRKLLGLHGLWNYDIRRTLATSMSNELGYDDSTIRAILNHHDVSALSHYRFKSFDSLTKPIQAYADWLWKLKQAPGEAPLAPVPMPNAQPVSIQTTPAPPLQAIAPSIVASSDEMDAPALSGREREVMVGVAHGQSSTYIGARLGIAPKTVEYHRARIMDKLHLTNAAQLIRYAIAHEADITIPAPVQPTLRPMIAPAVVSQTIPAPVPIAHLSRTIEREEWPG